MPTIIGKCHSPTGYTSENRKSIYEPWIHNQKQLFTDLLRFYLVGVKGLAFNKLFLRPPSSIGGEKPIFFLSGGYPTEEAFDKNARGAMHAKRKGKALSRPRFGAQFAQALIEI
jgi:hypothetical protein